MKKNSTSFPRSGLVSLFLLSILPSACGGSGGTADEGSGGSATPGESSGGSASGGALGTGGEPGPAPAMLPDSRLSACREYVVAQCERSHECGFLFAPDCEGVARDNCPDAVFSTGSLRTIEGTIQCAAELRTRSCDDVARYKFPECVMNGEVADGLPCIYSSQCASGRCTGGPDICGSCVPQLPSGAECSLTDNGGDACPNGETCVDGICQSYARSPDLPTEPEVGVTPVLPGLGAACTAACSGDLLCVANDEGTERVCRAPRTSGQPCYSVIAEPESPKTCHPAGKLVCVEGNCQPLPTPGMSCLPGEYGYVCDGICNDDGACLARPELGEACLNAGFFTNYCPSSLTCIEGFCRNERLLGETCLLPSEGCEEHTRCEGGVCVATDEVNLFGEVCGF